MSRAGEHSYLQISTAVAGSTSTSDVLLFLETGLDVYRKWKARVADPGHGLALWVVSD